MRVWQAHDKRLEALAFSPDGRLLASAGWEPAVKMWEVASGRLLWRTDPPGRGPFAVPALAFSPAGRWLAATEDAGVRVREPETGHPIALLPRSGRNRYGTAAALAFTPDERRLVTDGSPGPPAGCRLQWWQTGDWTELPGWQDEGGVLFLRAAIAPDGRTLATINFTSVQLWDIAAERVRWSAPVNVSHYVTVLALSADGSRLAFAAGPELAVMDVVSGRRVANLRPSVKHVQGAAFAPDGRTLVTVSNDATAIAWDTTIWGQKHAYAWRIGKLKCVGFSPDGTVIAAGGESGKIVLWDAV